VRFDFERVFAGSHKPYPCWAILDPAFHWAVRSYEQHFVSGMRIASTEYNPEVADVAFPKRIVEQELGFRRELQTKLVAVYQNPQPSHAVAREFTLEDFGLQPPKSGIQPLADVTLSGQSGTTKPIQSGQLSTPSAAAQSPSVTTVTDGNGVFRLIPRHFAVWAAGFGIFFYLLFLWSRAKSKSKR
jgi:hypothetical protein